jgi:uncharacterized protein (TIRG00374 family)
VTSEHARGLSRVVEPLRHPPTGTPAQPPPILLPMSGEGAGHPGWWWPRARVRRLSDVARLLATVGGLAVFALLAALLPGAVAATASAVPAVVRGVPRVALSVANVVASLAVLGVLVAVAIDALRLRRFAFTSATLACAVGIGLAATLAWLGDGGGLAAARTVLGPAEDSAVVPVVAAVAFLVGGDLQRRRRWLGLARGALVAAIACSLGLGSLTVPGAGLAVLLGAAAGLGVRVATGVAPARPPEDVVRAVLTRAGIAVEGFQPLEQAAGRIRYVGHDAGGDLQVTVVDPDRPGVPLARRAWRVLRFRTRAVGRPALSLRGQLERQALSAGLARSAGVAVPPVLALLSAGQALVLVERPLVGSPLPAAGAATTDGGSSGIEGLTAAFRALRRLHDAGVAHGGDPSDSVVLLPDGDAGFTQLRSAQPAASDLQRDLDAVALLVAGAARVGAAGAVTALRSAYSSGRAANARLAALVQPLALPGAVRRAVRGTSVLDDARAELAGPDAAGTVTAPRLERLRPRTVLSVAGATVAAHILATQLSEVSIGSALGEAQPRWLAVALLGSGLTYLGSALTLQAFAPVALPLTRTASVQLASSFLTLITPPTVGHVGLNIRYLQRSGVPTATAAGAVAVSQVVTIAVTVAGLLVSGWLSGVSTSRPSLLPSGDVLAVLIVAAAVLGLLAAAPQSRRLLHRRIEPLIRRTLPQLVSAATDPRRLGIAVLGILVLNGANVLALYASLRAFSATLALPALIVVYLVASTVGSAAPTPGGLGAVEAALVGGLTATGVPVSSALTAVLAFRAATFWLPAPVGWAAFVALQRRQRI